MSASEMASDALKANRKEAQVRSKAQHRVYIHPSKYACIHGQTSSHEIVECECHRMLDINCMNQSSLGASPPSSFLSSMDGLWSNMWELGPQ